MGKVTMRNPSLPHQIVIRLVAGGPGIVVSCNCRERGGLPVLEVRNRWDADEAFAVCRAHLPAVREDVA